MCVHALGMCMRGALDPSKPFQKNPSSTLGEETEAQRKIKFEVPASELRDSPSHFSAAYLTYLQEAVSKNMTQIMSFDPPLLK